VQPFQQCAKSAPFDKSRAGKEVSEVQVCQQFSKSVPLDISIPDGKEVSPVQARHVLEKFVPSDRSSAGKVARAVQLCHVPMKLVPESNPVARNEVREEH